MKINHFSHKSHNALHGFSLIELMVGMVIALIASIVIFQVLAVSEGYKRTTTGGSDALQSGGFSAYSLSRLIGAGGGGFATTPNALGCPLGLFRGATQVLGQDSSPFRIADELPAPFEAAIDFRITLVPALIIAGADSDTPDVIITMAGNHPSIGRHTMTASQAPNSITLADNVVIGINSSQDATGAAIRSGQGVARTSTCANRSGNPETAHAIPAIASESTVNGTASISAVFTTAGRDSCADETSSRIF